MCVMFWMALRKYRVTNELIIQMALFFAILSPYVLTHMHERYGCLADVLAVIREVQKRVKENTGISLETEVILLGDF